MDYWGLFANQLWSQRRLKLWHPLWRDQIIYKQNRLKVGTSAFTFFPSVPLLLTFKEVGDFLAISKWWHLDQELCEIRVSIQIIETGTGWHLCLKNFETKRFVSVTTRKSRASFQFRAYTLDSETEQPEVNGEKDVSSCKMLLEFHDTATSVTWGVFARSMVVVVCPIFRFDLIWSLATASKSNFTAYAILVILALSSTSSRALSPARSSK